MPCQVLYPKDGIKNMTKTLFDVLEENGIEVINRGKRALAHCPFHEGDRNPSFTIYPNDSYFCWGCRAWGDAVKFLVDYKGMSYHDALKDVGLEYKSKKSKSIIKVRDTKNMYPFLYDVAVAYHKRLLDTEGAFLYLRTRGLTFETISKYKIGYTDGATLNFVFAEDFRLAEEAGLMNEHGYELLSHRITIPNLVGDDLCDFIVGRTVTNDRIKYLGIRTPKPLFGLYDVRNEPLLFLVEGQFDWLVLRQWGLPSIVSGGTHLSAANIAVLKTKKVVIIPDNDEIGITASESLHTKLGPTSFVLDYRSMGVKDVGEMGPLADAEKRFKEIVKEQLPWPTRFARKTRNKSSGLLMSQISLV